MQTFAKHASSNNVSQPNHKTKCQWTTNRFLKPLICAHTKTMLLALIVTIAPLPTLLQISLETKNPNLKTRQQETILCFAPRKPQFKGVSTAATLRRERKKCVMRTQHMHIKQSHFLCFIFEIIIIIIIIAGYTSSAHNGNWNAKYKRKVYVARTYKICVHEKVKIINLAHTVIAISLWLIYVTTIRYEKQKRHKKSI